MYTDYYTRLDDVISDFRKDEGYLWIISWLIHVSYYKMVPIRHLDHLWYHYCITFTLKKGMCVGELVQSVQIMPVQRKANTGTSAECLWNRLWGNVINFGQNKTFCRRKYISAKWHVQLCICDWPGTLSKRDNHVTFAASSLIGQHLAQPKIRNAHRWCLLFC